MGYGEHSMQKHNVNTGAVTSCFTSAVASLCSRRSFSALIAARETAAKRPLRSFMLGSVFIAAVYVSWFWYDHFFASPVELYHRTWKAALENTYDPSQLKNWSRFEHCYDNLIKTNKDAVFFANKMLAAIGDPYTFLLSPEEYVQQLKLQSGRFVGIGIILKTVKGQGNKHFLAVKSVMADSPALKAGLLANDTILSVAGKDSTNMTGCQLQEVLRGQANRAVNIVVQRGKRSLRLKLTPTDVRMQNVVLEPSENDVAHIVVRDFVQTKTADRTMKILQQTAHRTAIVLDLRNNPGGAVEDCLKLATAFISEGPLVTLKVRGTGGYYTETYTAKPDCLEIVRSSEGKVVKVNRIERLQPIAAKVPMVVLVNGNTASAAEMIAGALKDNKRSTIVGTRTFGKGIAQTGLAIANGAFLSVTCVHYFTPKGNFLGCGRGDKSKHEGLQPDLQVADSVDADKDTQLIRALQVVSKKGPHDRT